MSLKLYDPLAEEEVSAQPEMIAVEHRAKMLAEIEKLKSENRSLKAKKTWAKRIHDQNEAAAATVSAVAEIAKPAEMTDKEIAYGLTHDRSFKIPSQAQDRPKPDESRIGHHFTADDGKVYGDTILISAMVKVGGTIEPMGFDDFKAKFSDGTIEFMRDDNYPIPNKNGRAHRLVASSPAFLARILRKLEEEKLSINTSAKPEVKQVSQSVPCVLDRQETVVSVVKVDLPVAPPSLPAPNQVQLTTHSGRDDIMARIAAHPAAWPAWRKRAYGIKD